MARGRKTRMRAASADGKRGDARRTDERCYVTECTVLVFPRDARGLARVTSRIVATLQAIMSPRRDPAVLSHTPTIPATFILPEYWHTGEGAKRSLRRTRWPSLASDGGSPGSQISKMAGRQKAVVRESRSVSLSNACWISNWLVWSFTFYRNRRDALMFRPIIGFGWHSPR